MMAEGAEPLTRAVIVAWTYGVGICSGVIQADDAAVVEIEKALRVAEASGDNYAVTLVEQSEGAVLLYRDAPGDRQRGLDLLSHIRDRCIQRRHPLSELPLIDMYARHAQAKGGDRDGAIPVMRKSLDLMFTQGQALYGTFTTALLAETLLDRGADGDIAEAEAAVARLAAVPADRSVIREVWLQRMRALLARAHGDEAGYHDFRDRYRHMAKTLGYEGHIAWAEAMP